MRKIKTLEYCASNRHDAAENHAVSHDNVSGLRDSPTAPPSGFDETRGQQSL
jgi:hypothetical protein